MRGRYGSLYDSYRLSNSTDYNRYQGSATPEMIRVGEHLQGLYDTAQTGSGVVQDSVQNLDGLNEADKALANEVRNGILGKIKTMSEKGDWENYVEPVRALGREYAMRSRELAAPVAAYQKWVEDEVDNKDRGLTPDQKRIAKAMALSQYSGLKKDASGRLVGSFKGIDLANNIDVNKKVDTWMQNFAVQQGGTEYSTDDGFFKIKRAGKWEVVSPDRINRALTDAMANDQEYQAYKQMMGDQAGFLAGRKYSSIDQLHKAVQPEIQKYLDKGYSFQEAASQVLGGMRQSSIDQLAKQYAVTKYAKNNRWTESGQGIGDFALADYNKKLSEEERLAGTGANTVPDWAADPEKLTEEITKGKEATTNLEQQLAVVERQLKAPGGSTNTNLQAKAADLRQQIRQQQAVTDNNQKLWDNSRDLAIQDLKLSDGKGGLIATFKQYQDLRSGSDARAIAEALPKGLKVDGKQYTPEQVAEALKTAKTITTPGSFLTQTILTMPDGKKVNSFTNGDVTKAIAATTNLNTELSRIDKRAMELHKDAVKNFSVVGNQIGLNTKELEALNNYGLAGATFYESPGSSKVRDDESLRNLPVARATYIPETGRWTVQFMKDKKTGELTEPVDMKMSTNIGKNLFEKLKKTNEGGKWDGQLISLRDDSYSGPLRNMKVGSTLTGVPDMNGLSTNKPMFLPGTDKKVHIKLLSGGQGWALTYPDGTIVTDEDNQEMMTPSISMVDNWIQQLSKSPRKK